MSKHTNKAKAGPNLKQQIFVEEYLTCWNATRAAKNAGYSEKTAYSQGQRLLKNVEVSRAIQARLKSKGMSADEIIARLADYARGVPEEAINDDGSINVGTLKKMGKSHLVKETLKNESKYMGVTTVNVSIKLHDAHAALRDLGKAQALFIDHHRVDDWRSEAVALIRDGKLTYDALAEEFDRDLATELFESAGVPVVSTRETGTGG